MLTSRQKKALQLFVTYGTLTTSEFAEFMWPTSKDHANGHHSKKGFVTGKHIWLRSKIFLNNMMSKHLITTSTYSYNAYTISLQGRRLFEK